MDPVSIIVSALVLGIAAGLKPTAETAVKEAYIGLKTLIQDRYRISLENFEQKHTSPAQKAALEESLSEAKAGDDQELLTQAKKVVDTVKANDPQAGTAVGINIDNIEASFLKISAINVKSGTGAIVKNSKISGGVEIGPVTVGSEPDPN